jgi:predicted nuclease of predicted toxin-antitoxin system
VKLLFDENLSRKLVQRLADLYPGSAHVVGVDLMKSPDREIWDFARASGFIVVSTDLDFYDLATTLGPPPKVVWLRRWKHPTADAERVLRREAIRISEFVADPELGVLVLDRD